ncbi:tRNA pseudouridine(13) synthase TruD [Candidatus Woesearchaeota archaeon]|nr:tRNA pseudouridine(13) synthase TruD [Candidatus Woesearchaeota archaeon]
MFRIKLVPEDFVVREIFPIGNPKIFFSGGRYAYFILRKKNYSTREAVRHIACLNHIPEKSICFAGMKDKHAVTEQYVSIIGLANPEAPLKMPHDVSLEFLGSAKSPVFIGAHTGNSFTITVRNLGKKDIAGLQAKALQPIVIPNYFGEQRFSAMNEKVGRLLVKKDFKCALDLILASPGGDRGDKTQKGAVKAPTSADKPLKWDEETRKCDDKPPTGADKKQKRPAIPERDLLKDSNNFIGALKKAHGKFLKFFVHAYQSHLFNQSLREYTKLNTSKLNTVKKQRCNDKILLPIIGFGTELSHFNREIRHIVNGIMAKEGISFRDFIIPQIPDISSEGDERAGFINIKDFCIKENGNDELNPKKKKLSVSFSLPKHSYATTVVGELLRKAL